jgi:hemerythrin
VAFFYAMLEQETSPEVPAGGIHSNTRLWQKSSRDCITGNGKGDITMDSEWTEELTGGVEKIDSQHKEMFQRINALRTALRQGAAQSELDATFTFLEGFVADHFALEEKYMRRYNYPGILAHRAEHEGFARDLFEYKKKWRELSSRNEFTSFLEIEMERRFTAWLTDHIGKTDKKMAAFLIERM